MPPPEPKPLECVRRFSGPNAEVWMHPRCIKEMEELGKSRAKITSCMDKLYCAVERPDMIPAKKLNRNEGRHGASKMLVQAFKNHQGRVYGVEGSVEGKRAFFAACAAVKKQQKADPDDLARAAERVTAMVAAIPGACV